jgi:uncharacterized protein (DUF2237 family)
VGLATDISGHLSFSSDIYLVRLNLFRPLFSSVRKQSPAKSMLRDNREDEWGARLPARNVLAEPLELCSIKPMTGFYRDGCCNTGREDVGSHTVCAVMTDAFLAFSKSRGNDLSTPIPEVGFAGLKAGDRWCLCAQRWQEAFQAAHAPRVVLRATHQAALTYCSLSDLKRFAVDLA